MKKRLIALALTLCLTVSAFAPGAWAAASANTAVQTAITLGAMDKSQQSALNAAVTRGALARMLTAFSAYRDSVGSQGTSGTLFADVPSGSQWAAYIRIAVQQGWMNGYADGSFRPDNVVTLEEVCTAALKLLGYKMTDLSGAFPSAQLNKATELGLRAGLARSQGEALNYEECAVLLYNTLTATTASGSSYGSTLGFTVTDGQVDVSSVMLASLDGPFIAAAGTALPFTPTTVYRNDKVSDSAELDAYDVYYYSESLQTVWIYTKRAAGRITAVSPSASAPTSVTVAGSSYTIGSSAVASQISSLNGGGVGQVVTLLLGMNNVAAGIVTGAEADDVYYGVVTGASRSLVDDDNGADVMQSVTAMCTDGIARTVNVDKSMNLPTGWLVQITVDENGESIEAITGKSVSGTFSNSGHTLGSYPLADDIEILDTTQGGSAGTVRPSRLSGVNLSSSDVRYYTLNEKGQIDRLILNDVTGDLWRYGVLDDIKNVAANWSDIQSLVSTLVDTSQSSGSGSGSGTSSSGSTSTTTTTVTTKTQNADGTITTTTTTTTSSGTSTSGSSSSTKSSYDPTSDLSALLIPTTSEILWGVIDGSLVSTMWDKLTTNTGSLISIGIRTLAGVTDEPVSTLLNFVGSGATYVCYVNGTQVPFTTSLKYPVVAGGVGVSTEGLNSSTVRSMAQLMPVKIDKVGAATVQASDGTRYEMADEVQVYLWYSGQYYYTKLTSVNADDYYLTGWYDNFGCSAGKKVRVIVAVKKS